VKVILYGKMVLMNRYLKYALAAVVPTVVVAGIPAGLVEVLTSDDNRAATSVATVQPERPSFSFQGKKYTCKAASGRVFTCSPNP
jgi:hypothetical protein